MKLTRTSYVHKQRKWLLNQGETHRQIITSRHVIITDKRMDKWKKTVNLDIDFRTQPCRTCSMVPQSDTKAQHEWVEKFVITSEADLWQTYLQMIPRMILRLWYKWLEALKWSYDSLAQYFSSDSYALKQSCVIWVKWCPIALAEIFRINKLIKSFFASLKLSLKWKRL